MRLSRCAWALYACARGRQKVRLFAARLRYGRRFVSRLIRSGVCVLRERCVCVHSELSKREIDLKAPLANIVVKLTARLVIASCVASFETGSVELRHILDYSFRIPI